VGAVPPCRPKRREGDRSTQNSGNSFGVIHNRVNLTYSRYQLTENFSGLWHIDGEGRVFVSAIAHSGRANAIHDC
ncbi:MAG: hypothetical protein HC849_29265, partial [Oscillatoriales cyanobacterium RU_3_3]|nr:hypothetical protein [Oscillatoriales cyanobacterium RU_3_3]